MARLVVLEIATGELDPCEPNILALGAVIRDQGHASIQKKPPVLGISRNSCYCLCSLLPRSSCSGAGIAALLPVSISYRTTLIHFMDRHLGKKFAPVWGCV